ncbi:MAG TPA: FTR1 family protein [Phycisphaerae bacterium]|nr:FTR1 family protein [Phycisphaerae bacterium]
MAGAAKSIALPDRSRSRVYLWLTIGGWSAVGLSALVVVGVLIWQAITSAGSPNPTSDGVGRASAILDTGVLVFREGLEAILVLAALTASLSRARNGYWKPVALGAGVSFLASVATWFIVVAIISSISAPALDIQAGTGLLAIVVLLVIMNWFFHKVYWTGWITHHNRRKQAVMSGEGTRMAMFWGLATIGFTSIYREGFEVVLFLQSIRLRVGGHVVLEGVLIGLALTSLVAILTFVAQYKLPYKRMLVLTGIMLGGVLLVMVGEQVFEMQQAHWLPTHDLGWKWPDWMNVWFGVYPSVESLSAQVMAGVVVIGSYYLARRVCSGKKSGGSAEKACIVPDCGQCELAEAHGEKPAVQQISVRGTGR